MSSMSPGSIAGTILFVAPARFATLSFAAISTGLAVEAGRRVLRVVTDFFGYSPKSGLGKFVAEWTPEVVSRIQTAIDCPVDEAAAKRGEGVTHYQLVRSLIICTVITSIFWEFSKWLSGGEVSPYYNMAARFVGPLVLDTNYRHPVVDFAIESLKKVVPSLA
jgi:hypothetical protein